jgi:protoporphyrinogen oxidase
MRKDGVIVIGAGPAGLTAAYELTKEGFRPTVLEGADQVGGISRTVRYRGYRFDIGGHRFFSKVPLINDLWHEILGEEFLLRPRVSRIFYNEHFFDYPLKASNALAGLGLVESALVCFSYAQAKVSPTLPETNFEDWVSNRFGRRLYRIFFKTYTEKVWGVPCREISADWAAQRIKNLSLLEALRNTLLGASRGRYGGAITSLIEQFHYPRFGPGMMWERCEDLIAGQGGRTQRGVRVDTIRHHNGRVEAVVGRTLCGERVEFEGASFISTMPLRDLIRSLDPEPPLEVLRAAARLRYRDYLTVVLMVNREAVFPDNWIYVHSPEVKMGRIQNYKNWSPFMVPDASKTSLGLEYFLWDKDEEWLWPDDRLIEVGIRECARLGLIEPREVEDGTVVRAEKAYPVYDQEYQGRVETLRKYMGSFTNLQTIGRNGLHRYNNQDHSMLTGVYAARNLMGGRHDVWAVNTEKEYHEEGRPVPGSTGDRLVPSRVTVSVPASSAGEDDMILSAFARLDPLALGTALGVVSGLGFFLATAVLLIRGGGVVGPMLALLEHYLAGFETNWVGACLGMIEVGVIGFALGYAVAHLRNGSLDAYVALVQRRAEAEAGRDVLGKV